MVTATMQASLAIVATTSLEPMGVDHCLRYESSHLRMLYPQMSLS